MPSNIADVKVKKGVWVPLLFWTGFNNVNNQASDTLFYIIQTDSTDTSYHYIYHRIRETQNMGMEDTLRVIGESML